MGAEEIHTYFKGCAVKWDCMKLIKLSHRVMRAQWSEEKSMWELEVRNELNGSTFMDQCDVYLSATGILKSV